MSSLRSIVIVGSLASCVVLGGCGTNPEPTSAVCTDFRAGADLSNATFGVTGELRRSYGAFAQAAGDLSAVANQMLRDVGAACEGLALELGADPADPRVHGQHETDALRAWCKIAAERFASVRPLLEKAHFKVQVVTPLCTTDTTFQLACEQRCSGSGACTESPPEERCPVEAREGICPGVCTGTCTGSESATATCEGACTGSGGHCDAICSGSCSEKMMAQTCTKPLAPPTCAGDVDCQKSCGASAAARASCPSGSLSVAIDAAGRSDAAVAQIASALERHLPAVFLAARGRAKVLADGASDVLDSAGHILTRADELGPMGAACGMLIGQTGDEARKSLSAALAGSQDLANAVTGDTTKTPPPAE